MNFPVLDRCPGTNLYIGGFIALRRPKALQNSRITHIVSVLDWQFNSDDPLIRGFQHLHIPIDDVEDENILSWFPRSNAFIHEGLNAPPATNTPVDSKTSRSDTNREEHDRGNGVLIHCAMGKSRSATILLAFLLWSSRQPKPQTTSSTDPDMVSLPSKPLSVIEALTQLRQGRGIAEPNEGFMDQLHMYVDMGCPTTLKEIESNKRYRRWMNKRNVEESLRINRAPEMADILFEDESPESDPASQQQPQQQSTSAHQERISSDTTIKAPDGTSSQPRANSLASVSTSSTPTPEVQIKCRKCRRLLAKSSFIIPHVPPKHRDPSYELSQTVASMNLNSSESRSSQHHPSSAHSVQVPDSQCAHIFLHPLSWMKAALAEGQLDGRLTCPNTKCASNVGKFAWQGLRCNCGGWVTPAFAVARGRVDVLGKAVVGTIKSAAAERTDANDDGGGSGGGGAVISLPPGMKRGSSGNL